MTFSNGIYPFYPQQRKAFVFDVNTIIVIVVFLTLALSFLLILPGIRGRARLYWLLRVLVSLFIGVVIVVVHFTGDWESGQVTASTPYKSFSRSRVNADIGLHIGLTGVNVTLIGNPVNQINETINYNEQFAWWFGADYDKMYSEGLEKGLPHPILYVAEKFTLESPCAVQNLYRIAGHYASATLWVAFCAWLISNMLFSMPVLVYGGYMSLVTGAFMIFAVLSYSTVRSSPMCTINFGPASLKITYGASFWLTLATGLLCLLVGTVVIVLHYLSPSQLKAFFDLSEEETESLDDMYVNTYTGDLCEAIDPSPRDFKMTIQKV
uniref:Dual oxidase maturation factor 2 n=1 Tax=Sphenodon punctatus TaxID=8508 RepID=A0A8D0HTR2_SPHPU